jgi:hypothetical protein
MSDPSRFGTLVSFILSIADLLNGAFRKSEFQKIILPLTVLRRLDYGNAASFVCDFRADLSRDGFSNGVDLAIVLSYWDVVESSTDLMVSAVLHRCSPLSHQPAFGV